MRLQRLTIEVYSDVVGAPYVKIEGWPPDDPNTTTTAAVEMTVWANEMTVTDNRKGDA